MRTSGDASPASSGSRRWWSVCVAVVLLTGAAWAQGEVADEEPPTGTIATGGLDGGAIYTEKVKIKTSILGEADAEAVFEHPGGRTVISREKIEETGANALPDVLRRTSGVKVVEATGTGNTDTKLNIGVRGLDPRLTGRSTVLLDEIPIVVAPYGQPQASLFPVSLFSIHNIDVVRGGAAMRYGPQTVGGVINLSTAPIPETLETRFAAQADQFGDFITGVAAGSTIGKLGVYGEYSFRGGQSYREHSGTTIHSALLKGRLVATDDTTLSTLVHLYDERSELPGGLYPDAFGDDSRQSLRPFDRFDGARQGAALTLSHRFSPVVRGEVLSFYNRSSRRFELADEPEPITSVVQRIPRQYEVVGVEPRLGVRLPIGEQLLEANAGYRYIFESAHQERIDVPVVDGTFGTAGLPAQNDDNQLAANAAYVQADLWFLDQTVRLSAGGRLEAVRIRRRNNLEQTLLDNRYVVFLPGTSVWWNPVDELSLFASYGQSFGSPQFTQIGLARSTRQLTAEVADTVEYGAKVLEWRGIEASVTGFWMRFKDQIELDETSFENVGQTLHRGLETELAIDLGEWVETLEGTEVDVGYTYTDAVALAGPYRGRKAPWVPTNAFYAEVGYRVRLPIPTHSLRIGADAWYEDAQYTDRRNTLLPDSRGSVGLVRANWVAGSHFRYALPVSTTLAAEVRGGVKNVLNRPYFERTDDRNAGLLMSRPVTAWAGINLKWIPEGLPTVEAEE